MLCLIVGGFLATAESAAGRAREDPSPLSASESGIARHRASDMLPLRCSNAAVLVVREGGLSGTVLGYM
jgi:hypothetical protein